jgi:hypothetical protein
MSQRILGVLKYYRELDTNNPESEVFHIKTDIDRALQQAPLDEEERALITILYLEEPEPPERTSDKGRPSGGLTQVQASKLIITEKISEKAKEIKAGRILKRATRKLEEFLGEGYE